MGYLNNNTEIAKKVSENAETLTNLRRLDPAIQIRSLMREKQLKNSDMAARVGVSEECISRWLKGQANIQIDSLYKLANALEEPLTILFGDHSQLTEKEQEASHVAEGGIDMIIAGNVDSDALISLRSRAAANDKNRYIERCDTYETVAAYA
ncbi:helix-turn-helix transcriptional regulator [Burkholderia sp. AU32357]|uniref:helix-turn-helix domain-containing protein n=1 Tax=Burkholderia sp. AU32357 TaxID=2824811 RepID=UPI001B98154A|nr:helix-turn-helix transcriptional regulator [Burkholderia sp. AU32357]MBR8234205.1 helix-turn-helix domain-containing protein [Burkholderia sp. AU32357]